MGSYKFLLNSVYKWHHANLPQKLTPPPSTHFPLCHNCAMSKIEFISLKVLLSLLKILLQKKTGQSGMIWHIGMSGALYAADPGSITDYLWFLNFVFKAYNGYNSI